LAKLQILSKEGRMTTITDIIKVIGCLILWGAFLIAFAVLVVVIVPCIAIRLITDKLKESK